MHTLVSRGARSEDRLSFFLSSFISFSLFIYHSIGPAQSFLYLNIHPFFASTSILYLPSPSHVS
ncbi:hypothetical protein V8C40DRAFT_250941 [Trichoderma camerunense]